MAEGESGATENSGQTAQERGFGTVLSDGTTAAPRAGVILGRRRALPTGRSVVGGFLVAVAAVAVFAAALAHGGGSGQQFVVAAHTLPAGSIIAPGDVGTAKIGLPAGSQANAFRQAGVLVGRAVAVTVQAGELMQSSMLVPVQAQPATRPVSVAVNPVSLAGLSPGQSVDVLATGSSGGSASGSGSSSSGVALVARGATLMSIDQSSSNLLSGPASALVTLGVSTLSEVEAVVQAAQSGTVTLVAAEPSDGVGPGPGNAGS
jgi:Flp pilus assembly protein CpaB